MRGDLYWLIFWCVAVAGLTITSVTQSICRRHCPGCQCWEEDEE